MTPFLVETDQFFAQPELMACLRAGYGSKRPEMPKTIEHDPNELPRDAYGPGYLAYQLRTEFRDLCRLIGFDSARQEVAEIILSEMERKR